MSWQTESKTLGETRRRNSQGLQAKVNSHSDAKWHPNTFCPKTSLGQKMMWPKKVFKQSCQKEYFFGQSASQNFAKVSVTLKAHFHDSLKWLCDFWTFKIAVGSHSELVTSITARVNASLGWTKKIEDLFWRCHFKKNKLKIYVSVNVGLFYSD